MAVEEFFMWSVHRRQVLFLMASGVAALAPVGAPAQETRTAKDTSPEDRRQHFIAEAERMRVEAVAAGDQSYGAVIVKGGRIVGWGPSRVVTTKDPHAHAERVAIGDAQRRLGTKDLSGSFLYSTSRACSACEKAAGAARVARMYWGPQGADAGVPRS